MPLPPLPDLPDDDPIAALRIMRAYVRALVMTFPVYLLLVGTAVFLILVFALGCLFFGFDNSLSWGADFVPFTFGVISVLVTVKTLRDEHHNIVIAFVLFLGLAGTVVIHYSKARADRQNHEQIEKLGVKIDFVGGQNNQLLTAYLAKPAITSQEAEMERRQAIEKALRSEYVLNHDNVSPGLLAGTEFPPPDWMNKRLAELGEKWKVADTPSARPQPPIQIVQAEKSRVEFSFIPVKISTWPILEQTLPVIDGAVNVKLTFIPREHTAKALRLWLRLCDGCSYKSEPARFQAVEGRDVPTERLLVAGDCLPNSAYSDISFSVIPPSLQTRGFTLGLFYGCDNCEPVNSDTPTIMTVLFAR